MKQLEKELNQWVTSVTNAIQDHTTNPDFILYQFEKMESIVRQQRARVLERIKKERDFAVRTVKLLKAKQMSLDDNARIEQLARTTDNAYSYDRYEKNGWKDAIRVLVGLGLNDREVEAFVRSKHMRWAGHHEETREYGEYNGQTLVNYLHPEHITQHNLNEMVEHTFNGQ